MRYAEITIMVELSEDIDTKEREGALMDDINDTLVNSSEFVTALRSIDIKDITALVESADRVRGNIGVEEVGPRCRHCGALTDDPHETDCDEMSL